MKIFLASILLLSTIQLQSQTVAVTPEKLNIFYRGIDNPVTVVVENCLCKNIKVKANVGEFYGEGCHYNYKVCDSLASEVNIYVGVTKKSIVQWIDTITYRIKTFDDPAIIIPDVKYGIIDKEQLCNTVGILATSHSSEVSFWVESYSVEISRNNSPLWTSENIIGSQFQKNFIDFVRDICGPGDEVKLYNIKVNSKDCILRKIKGMRFTLK